MVSFHRGCSRVSTSQLVDRWALWELHAQRLSTQELLDFRARYGPSILFYTSDWIYRFNKTATRGGLETETSLAPLDLSLLRDHGFILIQTAHAPSPSSDIHSTLSRLKDFDLVVDSTQVDLIADPKNAGVLTLDRAKRLLDRLDQRIQAMVKNPLNHGIAFDAELDDLNASCDFEHPRFGFSPKRPDFNEVMAECRRLAGLYARKNGKFLKSKDGRFIYLKDREAAPGERLPTRHRKLTRVEQLAVLSRYSHFARKENKPLFAAFHDLPNDRRFTFKTWDFATYVDVVVPFIYERNNFPSYAEKVVARTLEWEKALRIAAKRLGKSARIPMVMPLFDHGRISNRVTPEAAKKIPVALSRAGIRSAAVFVPHIPYFCTRFPGRCDEFLGPNEPAKYLERKRTGSLREFLENLRQALKESGPPDCSVP